MEDFTEQARMIGKRFVQKGYSEAFIMKKIEGVFGLEREVLISDKPKEKKKWHDVTIVLDYNIQFRQIEFFLN